MQLTFADESFIGGNGTSREKTQKTLLSFLIKVKKYFFPLLHLESRPMPFCHVLKHLCFLIIYLFEWIFFSKIVLFQKRNGFFLKSWIFILLSSSLKLCKIGFFIFPLFVLVFMEGCKLSKQQKMKKVLFINFLNFTKMAKNENESKNESRFSFLETLQVEKSASKTTKSEYFAFFNKGQKWDSKKYETSVSPSFAVFHRLHQNRVNKLKFVNRIAGNVLNIPTLDFSDNVSGYLSELEKSAKVKSDTRLLSKLEQSKICEKMFLSLRETAEKNEPIPENSICEKMESILDKMNGKSSK